LIIRSEPISEPTKGVPLDFGKFLQLAGVSQRGGEIPPAARMPVSPSENQNNPGFLFLNPEEPGLVANGKNERTCGLRGDVAPVNKIATLLQSAREIDFHSRIRD
jgi:hypothetical protein